MLYNLELSVKLDKNYPIFLSPKFFDYTYDFLSVDFSLLPSLSSRNK